MPDTRKLVAILAADVVGFSRLTATDEDRTLARLRALRSDLIDPTIAVHNGRVVKRTGDGALVAFHSVVDAVRCAVEVQNGMAERNMGVPCERRIEYRIGIHLGDVVEESDGDLMGDGVNIAARLEGLAKPGAICLSEDAYRQVKARLDLKVSDLGATPLKNIAEPIRVYALEVGAPAATKPLSADAHLSVVVLPFTNLSGDPTQDYFADGVTENLTTDLSRVRNSFVIARNTAFTFKGKSTDAKQIGRDLGVRYVLEGSVQRHQNRVRVNAHLIDSGSGAHLWADRFEESLADLFMLQDQVVARLANALRYEFVKAEAERKATQSPNAIDFSMRGWALMQAGPRITRVNCDAARSLFEQALQIDPNNSDALAGGATTYVWEYHYWRDPEINYDTRIIAQADRSIALDHENIRAYEVKSYYLTVSSRPKEALRVVDAGLAINPNAAFLYATRSIAETYLRQFDRAKSDVQQAMLLSPRDPAFSHWHNWLADAEIGLGNFDAAIDACHRAIDGGYRVFYSYLNLAVASAFMGSIDEARAALAEALRLNPELSVKWLIEHKPVLQASFDKLREVGLPEK